MKVLCILSVITSSILRLLRLGWKIKSIPNSHKSQKLVITSCCAKEQDKVKVLRCNFCVFGFVIFVLLLSWKHEMNCFLKSCFLSCVNKFNAKTKYLSIFLFYEFPLKKSPNYLLSLAYFPSWHSSIGQFRILTVGLDLAWNGD